MRKTKTKRESFWRKRMLPFVIVWTISIMGIASLSRAFESIIPLGYFTLQQVNIILTLIYGGLMGLVQVLLVERLLKRSMRGWLIFTVLGSAIRLFLSNLILSQLGGELTPAKQILFFMVSSIPTLLQTLWLLKHVHRAWLWFIVTLIGDLAVTVLYRVSPTLYQSPLAWIIMVMSGLIQGSLIHYLWSHPQQAEKSKVDFAEDEHADDEGSRIERLQERDQQTPLWDRGDDQIRHSEA